MKKKCMALLGMMSMVTVVCMFGGCGDKNTTGEAKTTEVVSEETGTTDMHVVTFYDSDGTTILDTVEVVDGECPTEYTPEKDGYIFVGWFATPQMSHRFDFQNPVTEDSSVFAGFVSYVADEREFAIVGGGTCPTLMESNWGAVIGDAQKMKKQESGTENIYEITLDLNEGDEFQFAMNTYWHDQRGYGYLDTISFEGKDYFENSGGLGETSTKRSNIKCAIPGNYTFMLKTYPGEDLYETENANYTEENKEAFNINPYDTITWTYNGTGSADAEDMQTNYYIKGATVTGWEDVYSEETEFVEENGLYTLKIVLTQGDEFMFTSRVTVGDTNSVGTEYIRYTNIAKDDKESLSYVTEGGGANLVAAQEGTYVFTYDSASKVLTVTME